MCFMGHRRSLNWNLNLDNHKDRKRNKKAEGEEEKENRCLKREMGERGKRKKTTRIRKRRGGGGRKTWSIVFPIPSSSTYSSAIDFLLFCLRVTVTFSCCHFLVTWNSASRQCNSKRESLVKNNARENVIMKKH